MTMDGLMPELRPGDVRNSLWSSYLRLKSTAKRRIYIPPAAYCCAPTLPERRRTYAGTGRSFLSFPMELANLVRSAAREVFPEDVQSFMLGLLIGDTSGLYDDFELDNALSVSGIRHVVAVSGMHLSFLYAVLVYLLGKRRASIFGVPVIVLFTFMTAARPQWCAPASC